MTSERKPILLWGDLVKNKNPILRRALVGDAAHECMYAWVYLTDYLGIKELQNELSKTSSAISADQFIPALVSNDIWKKLDRAVYDPNFQINAYSFEAISYLFALAKELQGQETEIVELGSTFFTAIDKFSILKVIAEKKQMANIPSPAWVGLDNSPFARKTATVLHQDSEMTLLDDYVKYKSKNKKQSIFYSRFVSSYVFNSAEGLADFVSKNFDSAVIEDAFSVDDKDYSIYNHGQKETFSSFKRLAKELTEKGFKIYILDHYADYPANTNKCIVIKFIALRDFDIAGVQKTVEALGFQNILSAKPYSETQFFNDFEKKMTPEMWRVLKYKKSISPVWGKIDHQDLQLGFVQYSKLKIKNKLSSLSLLFKPWGKYKLQGYFAEEELIKQQN